VRRGQSTGAAISGMPAGDPAGAHAMKRSGESSSSITIAAAPITLLYIALCAFVISSRRVANGSDCA